MASYSVFTMKSYGTPENTHFHNHCPCCQRNPTPPTRQAGAPANSEKKRRIRRTFKKRARRENKNLCKQEG